MLKLLSGSVAIRVSGAAAQVLMLLVITRACGPTQAGFALFGYSLVMIASTLARAGTELSGLRASAHLYASNRFDLLCRETHSRLFLVSMLSIVGGLGLLALEGVVAHFTFGEAAISIVRWSAASIIGFALIGLYSELFKGIGRPWLALSLQNLSVPVPTIMIVLIIAQASGQPSGDQVAATICVVASVAAATSVGIWARITRCPLLRHLVSSPPYLKVVGLVREAPALLVVAVVPIVMQWTGATVLGFLASPADVAGYSVAARISIAVSVVHSATASIASPRIAIAHERGDSGKLRDIVMQTGMLISAITLPFLLVMIVFAPAFLGIFGSSFSEFAPALRILLVGQLAAAVIGHSGLVLVLAGQYAQARVTALTAAGSLAVLMVLLTPAMGATGAAIAASTSVVLGHLAGVWLVHRTVGVWTVPTSFQDAVSTARGIRSTQ